MPFFSRNPRKPSSRPSRRAPNKPYRPALEQLEVRCVPSVTLVKAINRVNSSDGIARRVPFTDHQFIFNVNRQHFVVQPSDKTELWVSDGTTAGTTLLHSFALNFSGYGGPRLGSAMLFRANEDGQAGDELWKTDG